MDFLPFTRPSIDEATIAGVADVLRSGWITSGPQVLEFEKRLTAMCEGRPVIAVNSGTAALELALRLANVGVGDEVITTPLSWVATSNVILNVGAWPVFVDVDPKTRNIDLKLVEKSIRAGTKAIMPVYLAGLPVDQERLHAIADRHGLRVIEDAAQAMGSEWEGQPIGAAGDMTAFSFHPNKNITTTEGGALVVPDEATAKRARLLRLQGVTRSGEDVVDVAELGYKWNLTDVAARIGIGQLERLREFTERRRALAKRYFDLIDRSLKCELPPADFKHSNWHMFHIVLPESMPRAAFISAMREQGIGIAVHYPCIHLFSLYRRLGWKEGDCPHAERIGRSIVSLPLFPAMQDGDVDRVCQAMVRVFQESK